MKTLLTRKLAALAVAVGATACQSAFPTDAPLEPGEAFAEVTLLFDS